MNAGSPQSEPLDREPRLNPVGGPVKAAWREGTLTRAWELEALRAWVLPRRENDRDLDLSDAVLSHLEAARDSAKGVKLNPKNRFFWMFRSGSRFERAMSNLDAAESQLLNFAPASWVVCSHADHELADRSRPGRPPGTPAFSCNPTCDPPAVPGQERRRGHREHLVPPASGISRDSAASHSRSPGW